MEINLDKEFWGECQYCVGEGGKDIGIEANSENFQYIEDGEYMQLGWEECKHCKGTGFIKKRKLKD